MPLSAPSALSQGVRMRHMHVTLQRRITDQVLAQTLLDWVSYKNSITYKHGTRIAFL